MSDRERSEQVRVLVVDDERVVREGLAMILSVPPDIEVVGRAADGREALRLCQELEVDVALVDVRMPVLDGLGFLERLSSVVEHPPRVVVLTTFEVDEYVARALAAGAVGFLLKSSPQERIVAAVRDAAAGETTISAAVMGSVIDGYLRSRGGGIDPADRARLAALTERERAVLRLVGEGLGNARIAAELVVSLHTVKSHVSHILTKCGYSSRGQAAALAHRCAALLEDGGAG